MISINRRAFILNLVTIPFAVTSTAKAAEGQLMHSPQVRLAMLEKTSGGRLGVYALNTDNGKVISHRADERFPMCSTFR
jgi:beta-lactamase class A